MPPIKANHRVVQVTNDNVKDSQSFEKKDYIRIYTEFLKHNDYGFFAYVDNVCVARCWGVVNPVDVSEDGVPLGLEDDSVFVHYVETDKRYRGMGLGKECLAALIDKCKNQIMYVTINADNQISLKLHKGFGFKEIGMIRVKKRFMKIYSKLYRFDK